MSAIDLNINGGMSYTGCDLEVSNIVGPDCFSQGGSYSQVGGGRRSRKTRRTRRSRRTRRTRRSRRTRRTRRRIPKSSGGMSGGVVPPDTSDTTLGEGEYGIVYQSNDNRFGCVTLHIRTDYHLIDRLHVSELIDASPELSLGDSQC